MVAAPKAATTPNTVECADPSSRHPNAPLIAGYVVTNCAVGFGAPDTVRVDALEESALALCEESGVDPASRIVKRGEMAYIPPCVELMKRR